MYRVIIALVVAAAVFGGYFYYVKPSSESSATKEEAYVTDTDQVVEELAPTPSEAPIPPAPSETAINTQPKTMIATLQTTLGDITLEFFSADAPKTVENFLKLAEAGFYDGTRFHRVIKGFMIQGGDPLSKDVAQKNRWGTGGPGYAFEDEIYTNNRNAAGTIAMANSGPDTNGSQFFINAVNNNYLDSKHTVFGKVSAGMDVVQKIENTATDGGSRPLVDVIIKKIVVTEK